MNVWLVIKFSYSFCLFACFRCWEIIGFWICYDWDKQQELARFCGWIKVFGIKGERFNEFAMDWFSGSLTSYGCVLCSSLIFFEVAWEAIKWRQVELTEGNGFLHPFLRLLSKNSLKFLILLFRFLRLWLNKAPASCNNWKNKNFPMKPNTDVTPTHPKCSTFSRPHLLVEMFPN